MYRYESYDLAEQQCRHVKRALVHAKVIVIAYKTFGPVFSTMKHFVE